MTVEEYALRLAGRLSVAIMARTVCEVVEFRRLDDHSLIQAIPEASFKEVGIPSNVLG